MPRSRIVTVLSSLVLVAACASPDLGTDLSLRDETAPDEATHEPLRIVAPADGDVVAGNTLQIDLAGPATMPEEGEGAAYAVIIGTDIPTPGATISTPAAWSDTEPIVVVGLTSGTHRLSVVQADRDGARVGDAEDTVSIRVLGPTLRASAPSPVDPDTDIVIDVETDLKSGTVQLMVDPVAPPAPGQRIADTGAMATDVTHDGARLILGALEPGAHAIWVVATDVDGIARDPLVAARVDVDVS